MSEWMKEKWYIYYGYLTYNDYDGLYLYIWELTFTYLFFSQHRQLLCR